ncbi:MAG: tetratricopeptide repeat protein [bacterium]
MNPERFRKIARLAFLLCGLAIVLQTGVVGAALHESHNMTTIKTTGRAGNDDDKEQKELEKAARKIYKRALKSYENSSYWRAAVDLVIILDFYSSYSGLDDVICLLANCLYEMEMYDGADRLYRHLLKSGRKTEWIADALLGLQKSAYQKGEFQQSLKFYKALESHYTQDDNIHESRYYAGQTYFNLENYNLVLNIVPHIKKKSDFYPFALYTLGLANLKKKNVRESIRNFLDVIRFSANSPERRHIIASARLTLGYVYFELSSYDEAAEHLSKILPDYSDYPEVLLARGWASFKSGDFQAVLETLNGLIEGYPDYSNLEEAYFLRGQCYLKLGYHDFAIREYDKLIVPGNSPDSAAALQEVGQGLSSQEKRIEELAANLQQLESALVRSIPLDGSNGRLESWADSQVSIKLARENLIKKIMRERDEFYEVLDNIARLKRRFKRNDLRERWRTYAEYGKARALFLRGIDPQ